MSKLRIAITADTYPYASDVTNLVRAPFTARGLVDIINELGALPIVLPDVPGRAAHCAAGCSGCQRRRLCRDVRRADYSRRSGC